MSIRDNIRTKEEIFRSNYVTLGELSVLFNGSAKNMHEEMKEKIEIKPIKNRFEIMDLE